MFTKFWSSSFGHVNKPHFLCVLILTTLLSSKEIIELRISTRIDKYYYFILYALLHYVIPY